MHLVGELRVGREQKDAVITAEAGSEAGPHTLFWKELGKAVTVINQVGTHCPHGTQIY